MASVLVARAMGPHVVVDVVPFRPLRVPSCLCSCQGNAVPALRLPLHAAVSVVAFPGYMGVAPQLDLAAAVDKPEVLHFLSAPVSGSRTRADERRAALFQAPQRQDVPGWPWASFRDARVTEPTT
jgi:hypothetical protein